MEEKITEIVNETLEKFQTKIDKKELKFQITLLVMAKITLLENNFLFLWMDVVKNISEYKHTLPKVFDKCKSICKNDDEEAYKIFDSFSLMEVEEELQKQMIEFILKQIDTIKLSEDL